MHAASLHHTPAGLEKAIEQLDRDPNEGACPLPGARARDAAPFSRLLYAKFTLSQRIGSLLRCMDNALDYFGGVTTADVFDNMKTVVVERLSGPLNLRKR